jgi:hypothetical protein
MLTIILLFKDIWSAFGLNVYKKMLLQLQKKSLQKNNQKKVRMLRTFEHNSSRKFPTLNKT